MLPRTSSFLLAVVGVTLLTGLAAAGLRVAATPLLLERSPLPAQTPPLATQPATQPALAERDAPPSPQDDRPEDAQREAERIRASLVSGLIGSPHDFTEDAALGRDLCLPCHTPHLEAAPEPRLDRRPGQMAPLRPYQGPAVQLTSWSLLCLGCHDGVLAGDVYSNTHNFGFGDQLANSRTGTTGLRSHPMGIEYPRSAEGYHPREVVEAAGLPLPNGTIQCTTCHDAHNTDRHPGMLHISNRRSQMCLVCHDI